MSTHCRTQDRQHVKTGLMIQCMCDCRMSQEARDYLHIQYSTMLSNLWENDLGKAHDGLNSPNSVVHPTPESFENMKPLLSKVPNKLQRYCGSNRGFQNHFECHSYENPEHRAASDSAWFQIYGKSLVDVRSELCSRYETRLYSHSRGNLRWTTGFR